jgi:hypothetical protein
MSKEDSFENARIVFEQIRKADEEEANKFWNNLSYEDKCNAFHAVVSRIHEGEIKLRGSYRYVLYDIFGFGPDMYGRGMNCGFMALHNSIMDDDQFNKAHLEQELDHDR